MGNAILKMKQILFSLTIFSFFFAGLSWASEEFDPALFPEIANEELKSDTYLPLGINYNYVINKQNKGIFDAICQVIRDETIASIFKINTVYHDDILREISQIRFKKYHHYINDDFERLMSEDTKIGFKITKILLSEFPNLNEDYLEQFSGLFLDLQLKSQNSEISTKAVDLRGLIGALRTINRGLDPILAIKMGILGKTFDEFEKEIISDVIELRIPKALKKSDIFNL